MSAQSALTVLANPLDTTKLFQFHITGTFNLGLNIWTASSGGSESATTQDVGIQGPIWYPSSISAVLNQDQVKVFGFIQKSDSSTNPATVTVAIAQLSPAFNLITAWDGSGNYGKHITAVEDSSNYANLLYAKLDSTNPTLQLTTISDTVSTTQPSVKAQPTLGAFIASYSTSDNIFGIYQTNDDSIWEVDPINLSELTVDNTEAKSLTPLATCTGGSDGSNVYCYFLNSKNLIYKAVKSSGSWASAEAVGGHTHHKADDSTQLAALSNGTTAKSNTIFFIKSGESSYTRLTDQW